MKHQIMGTKLRRRACFRSLLVLGLLVSNSSGQSPISLPNEPTAASQGSNRCGDSARTLVNWLGIRQRNDLRNHLVELPSPSPNMKLVPQVPFNLPSEIITVAHVEESNADVGKVQPAFVARSPVVKRLVAELPAESPVAESPVAGSPVAESQVAESPVAPAAQPVAERPVAKSRTVNSGTPTIIRFVVPAAVGPEDSTSQPNESLLDLDLPSGVVEGGFFGRKVIHQQSPDPLPVPPIASRVSVAPTLKFSDTEDEPKEVPQKETDTPLIYEPVTDEPLVSSETVSSESVSSEAANSSVMNAGSAVSDLATSSIDYSLPKLGNSAEKETHSLLQTLQLPPTNDASANTNANASTSANTGRATIVGSTSKNTISMRISAAEPTHTVPQEASISDQPKLKPSLLAARPVTTVKNSAPPKKERSVAQSKPPEETATLVRAVQPAGGMKTVSEIESVIAQYEQSSGPQAGAGQIRELNRSIKKNFPGSRIEIKSDDEGLVVVGVAASEKEAEKILSVVRKTTLAPVKDRVTTKRVSTSTFDE